MAKHKSQQFPIVKASKITIRQLAKGFGGNILFDNANIQIEGDKIVMVVGPNGAGKTTLLDMICGMKGVDGGKIELFDKDVTSLNAEAVFQLGVSRLFQDVGIFETLTALQNVQLCVPEARAAGLVDGLFGGAKSKEAEAISLANAQECLDSVDMLDKADHRASDLSFGEKRLVGIARLLATRSSIWLLDEPCSGISEKLARRVLALLKKSSNDGRLVVVVEHALDLVAEFADEVYLVGGRKISELSDGEKADVKSLQNVIGNTLC